ncbi:MAG: SET domain protein [bacterium ADurb.Bin400]|nr:MAG: SET domain protein [bacterium ADurb.Bin400]
MKTDDVYIGESKIHRLGVFAGRDFARGEVVLHWDTAKTISNKDFSVMTEEERQYVAFVDNQHIVMQEPEKYVNHSCDANTASQNCCDIALRDIKEGEEITSDYSRELAPDERMDCRCGSKNCRKVVSGPATL